VSKLRVFVVITTFLPSVGGAEMQTLVQCQHLLQRGHAMQVMTFHHNAAWSSHEVIDGVPVTRVARFLLGRRKRLPRLLQKILYLLAIFVMGWTLWQRRNQYDVLQVCQFNFLVFPLALVCWLAKKPMSIIVISAGAGKRTKTHEPAKLLAGPLDPETPWLVVDGKTWIDGDLYGLQAAGPVVVKAMAALLRRTGAIIVVLSSRMRRYVSEHHLALADMYVIPNGVDLVRFQPLPADLFDEQRSRTVVCVSKLRYEKGIDVLLQAWAIVQRQRPEARLILVGSGPIQTQLEKMAQALGIADTVEFAGLQRDVPAQFQRGAIAILPSRWEGMPNALLEAMASGCACVATRVSGSEDLITPGHNGLLVEPEDAEEMAQALLTLLNTATLVKRFGQAARATVEQQYGLEQIIDRYVAMYHLLLKHGQTR
jgi:glycosyltransferase involved in cell wall biosynthesis